MLRITAEQRDRGLTKLRLEGRVVGPWIGELQGACDAVRGSGGRLELDLTAVSFLEQGAVCLLARLVEQGVVVSGCTAFVREQLRGGCHDHAASC